MPSPQTANMSTEAPENKLASKIVAVLTFASAFGIIAGLIWLELNVPGWKVWTVLGLIVIGFLVLLARYPLAVLAGLVLGFGS